MLKELIINPKFWTKIFIWSISILMILQHDIGWKTGIDKKFQYLKKCGSLKVLNLILYKRNYILYKRGISIYEIIYVVFFIVPVYILIVMSIIILPLCILYPPVSNVKFRLKSETVVDLRQTNNTDTISTKHKDCEYKKFIITLYKIIYNNLLQTVEILLFISIPFIIFTALKYGF